MIQLFTRCVRKPAIRATSLVCSILLFNGCENPDQLSPSAEPASLGSPDFAVTAPPGIVFASFGLAPSSFNSVHTGAIKGMSPGAMLKYLAEVKEKGGRVLLNFAGEAKNADGTFNLALWKSRIDAYRSVNFSSYIADGTLLGHFIIDEPHFDSRWGGKIVPQATVEAMAKYSKDRWPTLATLVAAPPAWLANSTITYTHLDAGWATYRASASSNPTLWASQQVAAAKRKGLGVFAALNVLDGGNGSSGFRGNYPQKWAMSATELRTYGSALLAQSYMCGFGMWKYTTDYYGRADIKSAMAEISLKARNHVKTSCKQ